MTPHTLRRTFASHLAEVGVPPRRAMYLLGHTDPTLTMRIYQQVLDMGGWAIDALERVLGCTLEEAAAISPGDRVCGPKVDRPPQPRPARTPAALAGAPPKACQILIERSG
jgi:hypothetical protein